MDSNGGISREAFERMRFDRVELTDNVFSGVTHSAIRISRVRQPVLRGNRTEQPDQPGQPGQPGQLTVLIDGEPS